MHHLSDLVTENLRAIQATTHPRYVRMLDHAFDCSDPPFAQQHFGRRYFELARNAEWFANSLVANSALEGYGSGQIWNFSNRVSNANYVAAIRQHALDESRHSSMFVSLLRIVFPGLHLDSATRARLESQQPKYSAKHPPPIDNAQPLLSEEQTLSELVQVHITEIRALVLQFLLRSALSAYCPPESKSRVARITAALIRDESAHIDYTARIFEQSAEEGNEDLLASLFERHVRGFNELTLIELERENIGI